MTDVKKDVVRVATTVDPRMSISVSDYLFDSKELNVVEKNLTPLQWVNILRKTIKLCKPYLNYFHGFREIHDLIHREWWREINFFDEPPFQTEMIYNDPLFERNKIFSITKSGFGLSYNKGPKLDRHPFNEHSQETDRYFIHEEIFLTIDGKIVLATFERDRVISSDKYTKMFFKELEDEALVGFVEKSFKRITDPILCLREIIDFGIERRQEQLDQMKVISQKIHRLSNLVG